jgi:hypothetical protein
MSDRKRKGWRELCAAVSSERDSNKLVLLVEELIRALDEHERDPIAATFSGKLDAAAFSG